LLKECIDRFSAVRVLVIGDIILDLYLWGEASRISPEAPVPVVDVKRETRLLGGAANVTHNLATLGASPVLCGVIGDDEAGRTILNMLEEIGVSGDGIVVESDRPTSVKTRILARNQQVVRLDRETRRAIQPKTFQSLMCFVKKNLENIDAVVVSDYGKGVVSEGCLRMLKDLTRRSAALLAVDPAVANFRNYAGVDIITPNHQEAASYCGFEVEDDKSLDRAGAKILRELCCQALLITRGKEGMTLFGKGFDKVHIPTVAKQVFDVTGAGDTVIATLTLGLATGLDPRSAAELSNLAAGIVVGRVGTSSVTIEDLKSMLSDRLSQGGEGV
jgi:rfaE bifunctional protein kinase chain/domain